MTGKADAVGAVSQQFKDRTNAVIDGVMVHLNDGNAKELLGPGLSPLIGRGTLRSLVTFAMYADVLRMVRDMVMADGEISDEEVQESLGLLSVLAAGFAKVRKEYASFASLTALNARDFLTKYTSDSGLFGHANASTKWAGVNACRNIEATCGDSGPLNSFCGTLVSWADSVASADGMSTTEQQQLAAIRSLCTSARDASHSHAPATDTGPSSPEDLLTAAILESDPHGSKSGFTHMEDGAAALLADASYPLTLNRLVALSPYAAACLGRHVGGTLELNGLREISDDVAEGLSTRTKTLSLNGLVRLSDASAMYLSKCPAKLSLRGLEELDDTPGYLALAVKLAAQLGDLHLDGLLRIAPRAANALSQHNGRLFLRGLQSVDDAVLESLWKQSSIEMSPAPIRNLFVQGKGQLVGRYVQDHNGDVGVLQSLSTDKCDADAAQAMVAADMNLSFDELRDISPEVAAILADSPHDITISRLNSLPEASAKALGRHTGTLAIGSVESLSLEAARVLAKHAGRLTIDAVDDLPEDVVAVLSPRLEEGKVLTTAIAEQFLTDSDGVDLNAFTSINEDAAAILATSENVLHLRGLTTLTDEAAAALASHVPAVASFMSPTLAIGGYNGDCVLGPNGLRALAAYRGCLDLTCDLSDKTEDPEWQDPLSFFLGRQDQRLFKNFSMKILEALEQKDMNDLRDLADWTFSEAHGKSPWEVFEEFRNLMTACGNRTVWMHTLDEDDDPKPFYFFLGDEDVVVKRIAALPDRA